MPEVRFDLGAPVAGWIAISLRVGDSEMQCQASYIVDSMTDLVYAALALVERRPVRPILLYEEPGTTRISVAGDGDVVKVVVTRHSDLTTAENGQNGIAVMAADVGRVGLARAVWAAMRRLEGAVGRERIEAAWRGPFPAKEIAHLGEALR